MKRHFKKITGLCICIILIAVNLLATIGLAASTSGAPLSDSIWVDTSTCISKLENNNENGDNDGYHYSGDSMLKLGIWFGQAATYDFVS